MRSILGTPLALCLATSLLCQAAFAQVAFQRDDLAVVHGLVDAPMPTSDLSVQQSYKVEGWRKKMLAQFPKADHDGNGELTEAEAIQYHLSQVRLFTPQGKELFFLPKNVSRWTVRVPMRDGQTLPTEIYLPGGEGPWPVVLCRTSRGRIDSALDYGNELLRNGYAFVGQDLTPQGDFVDADVLGRETGRQNLTREDRAAMNARRSARNAGQDGHDAIEWIAQQPWCNGKIAMTGYSEASMQSKSTLSELPPHLSAVVTSIGTITRERTTVRRGGSGTSPQRPQNWAPPTESDIAGPRRANLVAAASKVDVFYNDRTGWFDGSIQGDIDEWNALKHNGKSVLIVGIGDHGPLPKDQRQPPAYGDCDILLPEVAQFGWLTGAIKPEDISSRMYYFLMGDATDPSAPGNVWKVTESWPPANTPTSWYLSSDGGMELSAPAGEAAPRSYAYDPHDPVLTPPDGKVQPGPTDQAPLKDRSDILRFDSAPVTEPIEISGRPGVEIFVSTDAPDTVFCVMLVDIYPDGHEWLIRESATMLRFRDGIETPAPAKSGEVYKLSFELPSTALVLNKGHRLGLRITSSSWPAYEIHPNTWDKIDSYDDAKVVQNSVHLSAKHPSRVTVPVVKPGTTKDYVPPTESK